MTRKKSHQQQADNAEQAKRLIAKNKKANQTRIREDFQSDVINNALIQKESAEKQWMDPVCKKVVVNPTHSCTHNETVFAFCSKNCREMFLQNPEEYVEG